MNKPVPRYYACFILFGFIIILNILLYYDVPGYKITYIAIPTIIIFSAIWLQPKVDEYLYSNDNLHATEVIEMKKIQERVNNFYPKYRYECPICNRKETILSPEPLKCEICNRVFCSKCRKWEKYCQECAKLIQDDEKIELLKIFKIKPVRSCWYCPTMCVSIIVILVLFSLLEDVDKKYLYISIIVAVLSIFGYWMSSKKENRFSALRTQYAQVLNPELYSRVKINAFNSQNNLNSTQNQQNSSVSKTSMNTSNPNINPFAAIARKIDSNSVNALSNQDSNDETVTNNIQTIMPTSIFPVTQMNNTEFKFNHENSTKFDSGIVNCPICNAENTKDTKLCSQCGCQLIRNRSSNPF